MALLSQHKPATHPAALVFFDLLCAVSPPKLNFLFHCTVSPFLIVTGVSVNQFSCAVSPPARVHEISLCGVPLSIFFYSVSNILCLKFGRVSLRFLTCLAD